MARNIIGIGTVGNDGTGDDLRTGATKINNNFQEIYQDVARLKVLTAESAGGLDLDGISFSSGRLVFTGADSINSNPADYNDTYLQAVEPTKNNIISLPDSSGTIAFQEDLTSIISSANSKIDSADALAIAEAVALDSNNVISLVRSYSVDSAEALNIVLTNSVDSADVVSLIDAAYILARTGSVLDSSKTEQVVLNYVDSNFINSIVGTLYLDSYEAQGIIDNNFASLNSHIVPATNELRDLGTDANKFRTAYIKDLIASRYINIDSARIEYRTNINNNIRFRNVRGLEFLDDSTGDSARFFVGSGRNGHPNIAFNTNLVPTLNTTFDLGDSLNRWNDIYLSGTTINIGGVKIQATGGGTGMQVLDITDQVITLGGGLTENQVKALADSASNAVSMPTGQIGQQLFVSDNNTNTFETSYLVDVNDKFVETAAELQEELLDVPTLQDIFNTWDRFSHSASQVNVYPANSSEQAAWFFNNANNTVYTNINSATATGFFSADKYESYTHTATYSSTDADNDIAFMVIGFVEEGVAGQAGYRQHTLTAVRQSDGGIGGIGTWALVYNISQHDQAILVNGSSTATGTGGWSQWGVDTVIYARKIGKNLTIQTSQFNSSTLDASTALTFDLSTNSNTVRFLGPVSYGYGAWSQGGMTIENISFTPDDPELLYNFGGSASGNPGGDVYEYDGANLQWNLNSSLSVADAPGRLFHNNKTGRTFFTDGEAAYAIGSVRQFNDVIYLKPLAAAPTVNEIGPLGLRAGMFATADGTNWDPASKSGSVPYPVFWDGSTWNALY
jgi:hypothetical protein